MHDRPQKAHRSSKGHEEARRQFVLVLKPLPNVDPIRGLRQGLKHLLRQHGLRCTSIAEIPADTSPPLAPSVTGETQAKIRS
jgi:hypothetical protein